MPSLTVAPGLAVTYRQQYRRCGSARCGRCASGAPGHGPYWYAFWFESGRAHSRYIGKELPPGVVTPADSDCASSTESSAQMHTNGATAVSVTPGSSQVVASADSGASPLVPTLRVRTLGAFLVWRGDVLLPAERWTRRKVATLFKLLLGAERHSLVTEQVIDMLWPDAELEQGAANLRSTVRFLRAILDGPDEGASYIQTIGNSLKLDPAPGGTRPSDWLDVLAFERQAQAALARSEPEACRAALALYGGQYLPDDLYDDWFERRRALLQERHAALLLHLARLAGQAGNVEEALWALRAALAADPCNEDAARQLMTVLVADGRTTEARRVYQTLARTLRDELGIAPEARTQALRATIPSPPPTAAPEPATPTNLPAALTRFIGRNAELAALEHALAQGRTRTDARGNALGTRLLTLTGVGGTGKTRLATEVSGRVLDAYQDGVWLVELAHLPTSRSSDPTAVAAAALAALAVREEADQPAVETLLAHLKRLHLLLVLDNCEHIVAACATLAARLLAACPALQILATSREAMGMAGETVWCVPPLSLPHVGRAGATIALDHIAHAEAVQLFVARAQTARPDFNLTAHNAEGIVQICRQLDGLPLAIELAAARLGTLGVDEIAARLHDRFRLLRNGNRAALPRHQTLEAAMDWSHELLDEPERTLLRRLAVFSGGWTLVAAEEVCAGGDVDRIDVLDLLTSLVQKSLVRIEESSGSLPCRYNMLQLVRHYAQERLSAAGEADVLHSRHLSLFLALAEEADQRLRGSDQEAWLERLDAEHDNFRAALSWCVRLAASGTPSHPHADEAMHPAAAAVAAVQLAGALGQFWRLRSHFAEGRYWLGVALAHDKAALPDARRLRTLGAAATLARLQGDHAQARAYGEQSLALARSLPDPPGTAQALQHLGTLAAIESDFARAETFFQEALDLYRRLNDAPHVADLLLNLGNVAGSTGDFARAAHCYEESLVTCRSLADTSTVAMLLHNLGWIAQSQGNYDRARKLDEEALALFRALGDKQGAASSLNGLGVTALQATHDLERAQALFAEAAALLREIGDRWNLAEALANLGEVAARRSAYAEAAALYRESLLLQRELGGKWNIASTLRSVAALALAQHEHRRAAVLLGAADALSAAIGSTPTAAETEGIRRQVTALRSALEASAFAAAWEHGRSLSVERATEYALDGRAC